VTYDPFLHGPPEYDPEDPAADDELWDQAARDQAEQESMAADAEDGPSDD
jgi:hypothetical protein